MNELEHRFGKQAAEEWSYLLDFLELSTGFSSNIILVPDAGAARVCASLLEQFLKTKGQRLEQIEIGTPEELQAQFAPWLLEGANLEGAGAIWLASVSTKFDPQHQAWRSAWQYAVARVNERRDELIRRYNIPIFIVAAVWTNEMLQLSAKDWWSIRSMLVNIKPEVVLSDLRPEQRDNALEMGRQVLREDVSGDALLDPDLALETAAQLRGVKGEEKTLIRILERAYHGLIHRERFAEAEAIAREALSVEEATNTTTSEKIGSLLKIGFALLRQDQLYEAEKVLLIALELEEANGNSPFTHGNIMDLLGRVYFELGRLNEAEKAFELALELMDRSNVSLAIRGIILDFLGRVLLESHRLEEAEKVFRASLKCLKEGGASLAESSVTMSSLGHALLELGHLEESEQTFRTALELAIKGGASLTSCGIVIDALGLVLVSSGRLEEAEKAFVKSIDMRIQGGDTLESLQITRNHLARVQEKLNRNP